MQFFPAPFDVDNPLNVQAWANESGTWRLEINRVMFGYRVQTRRGNARDSSYIVDYCAGNSEEWVEALATVVMSILRLQPDTLSEQQMLHLFPRYSVRPMKRDVVCWALLCEMAGIEPDQPIQEVGDVVFNILQAHRINNYMMLCMGGMEPDQAKQLLGLVSRPPTGTGPDPHEHVTFFP